MKKLLSLLTMLVVAVSASWADDEPTLSIGVTAQTTSSYLGNYEAEGITISSDLSYSSGMVQINSTPSAYDSKYLQISATKEIEKVSFLISGNGSNKSIQGPVFGWVSTPSSNTADTYRILDAYIVASSGYNNAHWFDYDFSGSGVKFVRLYRATKNVSSTDPEYTGSSTALGTGQTMNVYGIKIWLKAGEATEAPETPTFSVDGAVTGGTTTTIASANATKMYYAWTESATAPEKGDEAYTELSGASKAVTIPNVTGTKYLHAYGWNNYETSSTSDIKSAEFVITKDVTAPKTWNFATDFSDEVKTALETNFTYDDANERYKSTTQINKDTDTDLGTFATSVWSGLIIGRSSNITAGNLRVKENGYIQINGGNAYFKIKDLKDGDVIKVRCASANQTGDRTFTVTGATESSITAYQSQYGFSEATITKSGNGDLTLTQDNGINVWTISVNEDLPAIADETITTDNDVATYVTKQALDFTEVSELTAYLITSVNDAKTSVATEVATVVPANTPLLVKGSTSSIPVVPTDGSTVTTLLKASTGDGVQGADNIFAYSKTNKKFMKVATSVTIPAGKCYLQIDGVTNALDIDFEQATAVEAIAEANAEAAAPVKVIKNGKLYIGNFNVAGQQVK